MPLSGFSPHSQFYRSSSVIYDNHTLPLRLIYTKSLFDLRGQSTERTRDMDHLKESFAAAVNAIVESHRSLYDQLLAAFESYNASHTLPPRASRASRILDCEANGAHALIENLATAAKAAPRSALGEYPDLLIAECRDFLDFLEDNLNSSDCAGILSDIRQTEEAFTNLIKGLSGCDPNISTGEYSLRIDKFVCDLKGLFRDLGHAVVKLEYTIGTKKNSKASTAKCAKSPRSRTAVGGKGPRTQFMKNQLRTFVRFLAASSYDGSLRKINSFAAQCWVKNKDKWSKATTASGQNKGYSSAKVLADAYKNA